MTTNQLINSEVIAEKDESFSPREKFQFVLTGELLTENNAEFFRLENGVKFKVKRVIASSYPSGMANWQVVPTTDNDGQVAIPSSKKDHKKYSLSKILRGQSKVS